MFLRFCNIVKKYLWVQLVSLSGCAEIRVYISRLHVIYVFCFRLTITCSVFHMKYVAFIVSLQGHAKDFYYIILYEKNRLKCISIMLHYFNLIEIYICHLSVLQDAYYKIIGCAEYLSFIYRHAENNLITGLTKIDN